MENQAILYEINCDPRIIEDSISRESGSEFLFEYQRAVLLALKEIGTLNEMQYRYAEEGLKNQRRAFIKKKIACQT